MKLAQGCIQANLCTASVQINRVSRLPVAICSRARKWKLNRPLLFPDTCPCHVYISGNLANSTRCRFQVTDLDDIYIVINTAKITHSILFIVFPYFPQIFVSLSPLFARPHVSFYLLKLLIDFQYFIATF